MALAAMAGLGGALALRAPRAGAESFAMAVVALCFGWAAAAKATRWRRWRSALQGYGLGERTRKPAAWLVPAAEALVSILALASLARASAALALALLLVFSAVTLRAGLRARDARLACGCFGSGVRRDYRWMLVRNAGLAGCAAVGYASAPAATPPTFGPASGIPVILTVVGLAMAAWAARSATSALREGRG